MSTALATRPALSPGRALRTTARGPLRSVQGINSRLEHLTLRGERLESAIGQAIAEAKLERKITGASVIEITVYDPRRVLLRSTLLQEAHEIVIDRLHWRLVKVSNEGLNSPIVLTYEPLIVYLLKQIHGPHKAFRDKVTRAEFSKARFLEGANPRHGEKLLEAQGADLKKELGAPGNPHAPVVIVPNARFISPELHDVEPIGSAKEVKEREEEHLETRNKGLGKGTGELTVKGEAATKKQIENGEGVLNVAVAENSPYRCMLALMCAVIVETLIGTYGPGLTNILEGEGSGEGAPIGSWIDEVKGFLTNKPEWTGEGAIAYYAAHPNAKAYEIAQAVQASGAGKESNGKANYGAVEAEAKKWLEAFGTGEGADSVNRTLQYAFAQGEKENNWHCMNRLAGEVNWRCFESAGWVYFLEEPTLLESGVRIIVSDAAPGIIDTTFDYDVGKDVTEMTVTADAKTWSAPPGSVVSVHRHGPADGLYLVENISTQIQSRSGNAEITLKRPTEPLPEPLPKTKSVSLSGLGSKTTELAPAGMPANVVKMLAEAEAIEGTPYLWGGGHESADAVKHRLSKYDCSGAWSRILYVGGYLNEPQTSSALADDFQPGVGEWLTIWANGTHVWGEFRTTEGWKAWEEGGTLGNHAGWSTETKAGYTARHPKGC